MIVEAGKTYCNEFRNRRHLKSLTAETATYRLPTSPTASDEDITVPRTEFEAWAVEEYMGPLQ